MNCYVDSSIVLRYLLGIDTGLEKAVGFDAVGSSELLLIECPRVLDRYRLETLPDDEALAHLEAGLSMMKVELGFGVVDDIAVMEAVS